MDHCRCTLKISIFIFNVCTETIFRDMDYNSPVYTGNINMPSWLVIYDFHSPMVDVIKSRKPIHSSFNKMKKYKSENQTDGQNLEFTACKKYIICIRYFFGTF